MCVPRVSRGDDSITFGTMLSLGSIISRVSLIQRGSFGLNLLPIFAPFNIRSDWSLSHGGHDTSSPYKSVLMMRDIFGENRVCRGILYLSHKPVATPLVGVPPSLSLFPS